MSSRSHRRKMQRLHRLYVMEKGLADMMQALLPVAEATAHNLALLNDEIANTAYQLRARKDPNSKE